MMRIVTNVFRARVGGVMATAPTARPAMMRYVAPLSTTSTAGTTGGTTTFSNPPKPNELFDNGVVKTQGSSSSSSSFRDDEDNKEFDRVVGDAGEDMHNKNHMKAAADALKDEGAIDQEGNLPKNAGPEGQPLDEDVVNDTSSQQRASADKGNKSDDNRQQSRKEATEARSQASSGRSDYST